MQCRRNQTLMCEGDAVRHRAGIVVCEPRKGSQLGTLSKDTAETFNIQYMEERARRWKALFRTQEAECDAARARSHTRQSSKSCRCDTKVTASEQQHAADTEARCE